MRRLLFLGFLIGALVAVYWLNQAAANWHYIIPVQPGEVAYAATFDALAEDWQQYQGLLSAEVMADEGVLRLNVGAEKRIAFSTARPYFADFDLYAQATAVSGPLNNGYGVIFRAQDNLNYYLFLVSSDGYYQVMRVKDGAQTVVSTWIPADVVRQGFGAVNVLRVVANEDRFQFFVNGAQVGLCIPDDPAAVSTFTTECLGGTMRDTLVDGSIPNGQLGAAVWTDVEGDVVVDFDNIIVYGPQPVPVPGEAS